MQEGVSLRAEGRQLQEAGDLQRAASAFRRSVAVNPSYAEAYNDLGVVLESLGDLAQAEEAYQTALRLKPDLAAAHLNLGLLLEQTGRIQEASEHWRARIRMGPPGDPWVLKARDKMSRYQLPVPESPAEQARRQKEEAQQALLAGQAHAEAGRPDAAVAEYRKVLSLDPENRKARRLLREAEAKARKDKEAALRQSRLAEERLRKQAETLQREERTRRLKAERKAAQVEKASEAARIEKERPALAPAAPAPIRREQAPSDALAVAKEMEREKADVRRHTVKELYDRGSEMMREGRYREAAELFRQVLMLNPKDESARLALQRAEKARSLAEAAEGLAPGTTE